MKKPGEKAQVKSSDERRARIEQEGLAAHKARVKHDTLGPSSIVGTYQSYRAVGRASLWSKTVKVVFLHCERNRGARKKPARLINAAPERAPRRSHHR